MIKQTNKGAMTTLCVDINYKIAKDDATLRLKLESEGFKVAPEE